MGRKSYAFPTPLKNMRPRKEIEQEAQGNYDNTLIIEVLLDIRELLEKYVTTPTGN